MKPNTYNKKSIQSNSSYDNTYWVPANTLNGLDWNYFIAKYLDRDLHERLLKVSVQEMAPIISKITQILTLIGSGYFYTASLLVSDMDVSNSENLTEIKAWLLKSLQEADDTQE